MSRRRTHPALSAGLLVYRIGLGLAQTNYTAFRPTLSGRLNIQRVDLESTTPHGTSPSAQLNSSQQTTDANPGSREGIHKQQSDVSQSAGSSKPVNTPSSGILTDNNAEPGSHDHPISNLRPKYFRISGLPSSWSENDLFDALHAIDHSLTDQEYRPSIYPSCCNSTQTALLNLDPCTEHLQHRNHLQISESASRAAALLTIDSHFYNLTPLNVPKGEVVAELVVGCCSVIAVTGLAGHAFGSWRNRKTHQMWLKDLLPHDVQNIRIMSYGYDSSLLGHDKAENRLLDYQRLFIQDIENARSSVKSWWYPYFANAMHSIIFFGTPHQGMRTYDLEEMVDAESGGYETSRHNLLRQLREGSEFLETQKEKLSYIWEECKPEIVSFYETVQTSTVERSDSGRYARSGEESEMVNRFSAQLYIPNEQRVPVKENHTNMVKFASAEDGTYQTVRQQKGFKIFKWTITNKSDSKDFIDCLKSLKPSDYETYRDEIWLRRHENTCTWVLDDWRYRTWAEKEGQAILWISGDPGCGKSVLSSFLTKELTTRGKTNQLVMAYFFCDDKDERLRTAHAILVNLLTQLLNQVPDFIVHFLAEHEYTTNKENTSWSPGMLWRVFERIINDPHYECEEVSRTKLLDQLQHLLRHTTTSRPIKIIITSRPHIPVAFHLTDVIKLPLVAEDLQSDITTFVKSEVHKQPQFSGSLGEEVRKALIDGANGMFLWVSLILDDLKKSTTTTPRDIRKALKTLPPNLPGVYINILRKIRMEDQQAAQTILRWLVWAIRPLTLQELAIAIAILPEHTSMLSMEDDMHTDLRQVLRLVFGPIVRIDDNDTVHLIHQSAKDFLSKMNTPMESTLSFCLSSAESNLQLAISCLTYLSFDECEDGPVNHDYRWESKQDMQIRQRKLPFLDYAATHWPEHTRQIDRSDDQVLCRAFRKLAESPHKTNLAYQVLNFSRNMSFTKTAPLQVASSLGLTTFVEELLAHGADINAQGGYYGNALQAAARGGHEAVVAAGRGHEAVVRLLVDRGAHVNARGGKFGNALQAAAGGGHEAVVRLLVDRGAEMHAQDDVR
ncbi:hypothetical protein K440DRAFT_660436 [Wilcoxina mikolae CBS 423.85]|nr:hypothetical protein K440DRAFT_660436 [Wilcoxina mikolae CBS 423.85]